MVCNSSPYSFGRLALHADLHSLAAQHAGSASHESIGYRVYVRTGNKQHAGDDATAGVLSQYTCQYPTT